MEGYSNGGAVNEEDLPLEFLSLVPSEFLPRYFTIVPCFYLLFLHYMDIIPQRKISNSNSPHKQNIIKKYAISCENSWFD